MAKKRTLNVVEKAQVEPIPFPPQTDVALQEPELDIEDQVNVGAPTSPTPAQVAVTPAEETFRQMAAANLRPGAPQGHFSPPSQSTPLPYPGILRPFGDAMKLVAVGMQARREAWGEDRSVIFLRGDALHLRKPDGTEHTLIVTKLDITAEDWIVQ